jgi:hypothetical protein
MCHRFQKFLKEDAMYGKLKFSGKSMPIILALPMAIWE